MKYLQRDQIAGMNIHYLFYSLDYFLDAQKAAGFQSIELWSGAPHFYLTPEGYEDVQTVKQKIEERGLNVRVFTPENCTYQYQVAAQTPLLFEKSFQYFKNAIQVTKELGCKIMQINSGWGYWNEDRETAWARSREMLTRLAQEAEKADIYLAMESLRPAESQLVVTLKDAKRMFDEVNHPRLKILIDTTAMSVSGETIDDWFEVFHDNIIHTHFIDNKPEGHLIWGDGNADLESYLQALERHHYQGYLGQEITDFGYFDDPSSHDIRNMKAFEPYIK